MCQKVILAIVKTIQLISQFIFKVTVLHHLDIPLTLQNSFNLSPGTENQIAVTPSIITTAENAIHRLTPAERDCYTESEISLKYLPLEDGYRYGKIGRAS